MAARVDTVIFDLGGVVMANGRPKDFARRFPDRDEREMIELIVGPYEQDTDHPWHRLERGEIPMEEYRAHQREALAAAGIAIPTSAGGAPAGPVFEPSAAMVDLVARLRTAGIRTGLLTNNVREFRDLWWPLLPYDELFDDVVDSHEVGMRKPDPAIYRLALDRLGSMAGCTAFLDDVASNVAGAEAVGMFGVLVDDDPQPAIRSVEHLLGWS